MKAIVIGDVLGEEKKSGKLDSGDPWDTHKIAVLEGLDVTLVSVKNFVGHIPGRGEFVALECDVTLAYGKLKVNAVKRVEAIEAVYTATPGATPDDKK